MKRLLALLALAPSAHAAGFSLVVHGVSHHFSAEHFHEFNTGAGFRYDFSRLIGVQAGVYSNSRAHSSAYGLIDLTPLHWGRFSSGAFAGMASGYQAGRGSFSPNGGLVVSCGRGVTVVRVRYVPSFDSINKSVAALEASFKL